MDGYVVGLDGAAVKADRAAVEHALAQNSLLWLDLHTAGQDVLNLLREVFKFHPLAVRNVSYFGQRAKAENFGDTLYLVVYGASKVMGELVEVHGFYSDEWLITIRRKPCSQLDQVRSELAETHGPQPQAASGQNDQRPARGLMLYQVVSSLTDSFFTPLSDLDNQIDQLTERIFKSPGSDELQQLLSMQSWLVALRKVVTPQRDTMASLMSGAVTLPGRTAGADPYLRDLYDHGIRIDDLLDSYRDLLSNAMDAYLSMVSNRLNEVMKQLTVIATVFLPLSFLTGFFGQNFSWLTGHLGGLATFLILGIGSELVAVGGMYWLFRRARWVSGPRRPSRASARPGGA